MFDSKPKYHESNETDSNQHYALPGIDKVDRLQIILYIVEVMWQQRQYSDVIIRWSLLIVELLILWCNLFIFHS